MPTPKNNLLAMLMANPQEQLPSPMMAPVADPAIEQAKQNSYNNNVVNNNQPLPPPQAPIAGGDNFNLSYEKQLEDAFYKSMQDRELQNKAYQDEAAKLKQVPTTFADVNLRPALAFADSLAGTNTANTYQSPDGENKRKEQLAKLQDSINKNANTMSDDQLNYLKMKASEVAADRREQRALAAMNNREGKEESNVRKEYLNHPVIKGMKDVDQAASAIEQNAGLDGPSQQAMVYQFSKILDPGSVVREAEYAMSAANAGAINQARNYLTKLQTGQMLTPQQISEMKAVVKNMYGSYRNRVNDVNDYYKGLSARKGFDSRNVIVDPYGGSKASNPLTENTGKNQIKVSNGEDTRMIEASDLASALRDGYKQVN